MEENDEIVYVDGIRITADSIDEDGQWSGEDGFACDMRDMSFPVPDEIKGGPYAEQNVMAILKAKGLYKKCPYCKKAMHKDGIILMMEEFHIYPSKCCKRIVWVRNGGSEKMNEDLS